jgi:spectrin alpha
MHDVEAVLASEDLGRDLSGVKFLLKKHQLVEADIDVHVTEAQALSKQAQELIDDNHFNSQNIQQRTRDCLKRYYIL